MKLICFSVLILFVVLSFTQADDPYRLSKYLDVGLRILHQRQPEFNRYLLQRIWYDMFLWINRIKYPRFDRFMTIASLINELKTDYPSEPRVSVLPQDIRNEITLAYSALIKFAKLIYSDDDYFQIDRMTTVFCGFEPRHILKIQIALIELCVEKFTSLLEGISDTIEALRRDAIEIHFKVKQLAGKPVNYGGYVKEVFQPFWNEMARIEDKLKAFRKANNPLTNLMKDAAPIVSQPQLYRLMHPNVRVSEFVYLHSYNLGFVASNAVATRFQEVWEKNQKLSLVMYNILERIDEEFAKLDLNRKNYGKKGYYIVYLSYLGIQFCLLRIAYLMELVSRTIYENIIEAVARLPDKSESNIMEVLGKKRFDFSELFVHHDDNVTDIMTDVLTDVNNIANVAPNAAGRISQGKILQRAFRNIDEYFGTSMDNLATVKDIVTLKCKTYHPRQPVIPMYD